MLTPDSQPDFTYQDGILRCKGKIVVGTKGGVRKKIVTAIHDSQLGAHSGIQATERPNSYSIAQKCTRTSKKLYCSMIHVEGVKMNTLLIQIFCNHSLYPSIHGAI